VDSFPDFKNQLDGRDNIAVLVQMRLQILPLGLIISRDKLLDIISLIVLVVQRFIMVVARQSSS
jgi:hypothetical protein